jgi:hypothetical protein
VFLSKIEKNGIMSVLELAKVKRMKTVLSISEKASEWLGITYHGLELGIRNRKHMQQLELFCSTRWSEYFCSLSERDRNAEQGSVVFPKTLLFHSTHSIPVVSKLVF